VDLPLLQFPYFIKLNLNRISGNSIQINSKKIGKSFTTSLGSITCPGSLGIISAIPLSGRAPLSGLWCKYNDNILIGKDESEIKV